ncbi:MAG: trypsin-like peptidase domain-containing protein [Candidatus Niyogibacteria bacterium]|nr:trypsin-like peptidase domain-containing protein [Candidatus Niyogibacteria bacterium]
MDYANIVEKITPSIAKIYCLNAKNKVDSTGSGFLFSKKGILVTCDHVIEGSQSLLCRFSDDENFIAAKVAIRDSEHDLALLKLESGDRSILPIGAREKIKPGVPVIFSGFPLNLETLTTHQGILSAITKDAVGTTTYLIDGTVNPGNSGCPLMNSHGEVIGVVNATRRERSDLLSKVEKMSLGAISLHGIDLVEMYQALTKNMQLGVGYAVPASYIPEHKEISELPENSELSKK